MENNVYVWYNVVRHYTARKGIGRPYHNAERIWYNVVRHYTARKGIGRPYHNAERIYQSTSL